MLQADAAEVIDRFAVGGACLGAFVAQLGEAAFEEEHIRNMPIDAVIDDELSTIADIVLDIGAAVAAGHVHAQVGELECDMGAQVLVGLSAFHGFAQQLGSDVSLSL